MNIPATFSPRCFSNSAVTEESTPPDMATMVSLLMPFKVGWASLNRK